MTNQLLSIVIVSSILGLSCNQPKTENMEELPVSNDPHSYSRQNEARVKHLDLDLTVNFEDQKLSGSATYQIETSPEAKQIILDSYDLNIEKVLADDQDTKFVIGEHDEILGSSLTIDLTENCKSIQIFYSTNPGARALQWLSPEQTAQKENPFLFTQSQAILARTWIPCQDSPGIRFTYNATINVPNGLLALMSAENPQEVDPDGSYKFKMPQPIPSYLMALTVGQVEFKSIGDHTGVYAEPVMLDKCHEEFSDMEKMLVSAEEIYGPYAWGRYDVIVLPPSFPFGGMENPRLTFATPTIIAGDKSLTSLVAHELAHSWSGNLVTNATWNDFWLNEGFTVYFEQRIMEAVYGRPYSEMLAFLSFNGLVEEVQEITSKDPNDTKLKLHLEGRDPDDGMSAIAYDKGYLLLRKIEETVGRERFDSFLKSYFQSNAFKVMDTESFLALLKSEFSEEEYQTVDVEAWVYGAGLPENHPVITSNRFENVEEVLNKWMQDGQVDNETMSDWTTHEWIHFIRKLPEGISQDKLVQLDENFGFTESGNCEILAAWFQVTIRENYATADPAIEEFLINVGRRKFLTPTYKALIEQDGGMDKAKAIYSKARPNYHSVSTGTMDELLNWNS